MARRDIMTVVAGALLLALVLAFGGAMTRTAEANASCTAQCRAAHNQCRIATKGSPSCDSQLQACLSSCLTRR